MSWSVSFRGGLVTLGVSFDRRCTHCLGVDVRALNRKHEDERRAWKQRMFRHLVRIVPGNMQKAHERLVNRSRTPPPTCETHAKLFTQNW